MCAPQTYLVALILMLISMVCWGLWPNFLKKLPGWRLEYFYIDYTLGFLITAVLYGVTLGPGDGLGFLDVVSHAGAREAAFAIIGGFIWNIGNILLLTAIVIAGIAVAFPIAAIPAIVIGLGASYWLQPVGNGVAPRWSARSGVFSCGMSSPRDRPAPVRSSARPWPCMPSASRRWPSHTRSE